MSKELVQAIVGSLDGGGRWEKIYGGYANDDVGVVIFHRFMPKPIIDERLSVTFNDEDVSVDLNGRRKIAKALNRRFQRELDFRSLKAAQAFSNSNASKKKSDPGTVLGVLKAFLKGRND